jgi:hypothetical protein
VYEENSGQEETAGRRKAQNNIVFTKYFKIIESRKMPHTTHRKDQKHVKYSIRKLDEKNH